MRRGFTLIEFFVVAALIAVVIALTLPVLCSIWAPKAEQEVSTSKTFVGRVHTLQDAFEQDEEGNEITVHYLDVETEIENGPVKTELFTLENGFPLDIGKRYAFRAWDSTPHRHISEAIPIPGN